MLNRGLEILVFGEHSPKRMKHVNPVPHRRAKGMVGQVYDQMRRDFQIVSPITLHSSCPMLLAGAWSMLRETMLCAPARRTVNEVIAAGVSAANKCPFCVDVHTTMLRGAGESNIADAILNQSGNDDNTDDLQAVYIWAKNTGTENLSSTEKPSFIAEHIPQHLGTVLVFHYLNRMVNVFLLDSPFPVPRSLTFIRHLLSRIAGRTFARRIVNTTVISGDSLTLLAEAVLPEEFKWSISNAFVAQALARMSHAAEYAGRNVFPADVRDWFCEMVSNWQGQTPTMHRQWVDDAVADAGIESQYHAGLRLALLVAISSWQVDGDIVNDARKVNSSDQFIIELTSWSAWMAVRRISNWIAPKG